MEIPGWGCVDVEFYNSSDLKATFATFSKVFLESWNEELIARLCDFLNAKTLTTEERKRRYETRQNVTSNQTENYTRRRPDAASGPVRTQPTKTNTMSPVDFGTFHFIFIFCSIAILSLSTRFSLHFYPHFPLVILCLSFSALRLSLSLYTL